jgi:putative radical SAM enzyme (TIGR03279 family)
MQTEGIQINGVQRDSLAEKSGLRSGDILLSINSQKLRDVIDFIFYGSDEDLTIEIKRDGKKITLMVDRRGYRELGVDFKPFKVMTCRNNCIFCFVKQLPKGLRKTLYVKDEDYRMSFLYGNYITLSNMTKEDKKRIVEQKLSPLYISVHSTNKAVRNRLLGNLKNPDILGELKFFSDNKIRFNVQIVLCPGYNDGNELRHTLSSLYKFYPYLLSAAVVPVGLTMHRKQQIPPVEKEDAENALRIIESFQKRFLKKHGNPIIYAADELYLKAGRHFPPLREYGELHQIENGVGMVPLFLSLAKKMKFPKAVQPKKKFLTFTGISFYPFLKRFAERLSDKEDVRIDVMPVENKFFGPSITVAGLLTGRDVVRTALGSADGHEAILVPDVVLNGEDRFLDDITLRDVEEALGIPARKIESTPEGLLRGIMEEWKALPGGKIDRQACQ